MWIDEKGGARLAVEPRAPLRQSCSVGRSAPRAGRRRRGRRGAADLLVALDGGVQRAQGLTLGGEVTALLRGFQLVDGLLDRRCGRRLVRVRRIRDRDRRARRGLLRLLPWLGDGAARTGYEALWPARSMYTGST